MFLSAHCHVLLALWDGRESGEIGGTASVVNFHQNDLMPGYTSRAAANQRMLADDESDLVYHIVCSRSRPGGEPAARARTARDRLAHDRRIRARAPPTCRCATG